MSGSLAEQLRRTPVWVRVVAVVAGVSSLVLPAYLRTPAARTEPPRAPFVRLVAEGGAEGEAVREQAEMQDSAPLFLPTGWTYGVERTPPGWRQQERSPFEAEPPRLVAGVDGAAALLRTAGGLPPEAAVLRARLPEAVAAFGRGPWERLPARFARLEVRALEGGGTVGYAEIPREEAPAGEEADGLWQPAEWIVTLSAEGRVGRALQVRSSGSDALDGFGERRLEELFRLPGGIPAGTYRVVLGP